MLSKEQFKQVEESFRHSDSLVVRIGELVYVCEEALKHRKDGTIELRECYEVDETCFDKNGDYYGETTGEERNFILEDHLADNDNLVETIYYDDELKTTW